MSMHALFDEFFINGILDLTCYSMYMSFSNSPSRRRLFERFA